MARPLIVDILASLVGWEDSRQKSEKNYRKCLSDNYDMEQWALMAEAEVERWKSVAKEHGATIEAGAKARNALMVEVERLRGAVKHGERLLREGAESMAEMGEQEDASVLHGWAVELRKLRLGRKSALTGEGEQMVDQAQYAITLQRLIEDMARGRPVSQESIEGSPHLASLAALHRESDERLVTRIAELENEVDRLQTELYYEIPRLKDALQTASKFHTEEMFERKRLQVRIDRALEIRRSFNCDCRTGMACDCEPAAIERALTGEGER